ncbi:MAG: hypothetical protein J5722_04935, partial [Oscillospiraceae bacterium]|nr:hypothetical protein [Oscillospiraceae bacterium]
FCSYFSHADKPLAPQVCFSYNHVSYWERGSGCDEAEKDTVSGGTAEIVRGMRKTVRGILTKLSQYAIMTKMK